MSVRNQHQPFYGLTSTLSGVYTGTVLAIVIIVASLSIGSLIFAGDLAFGAADGIGIALLSAFIVGIIIAFRSSYDGSIAPPQDRTAPILGLIAIEVAAATPAGSSELAKLVNVLAAIAITSFLAGTIMYLLGRYKLGNLTRFVPYPVVGGFLCGSGFLLVKGALRVMTDRKVTLTTLPQLVQPGMLMLWIPGIALGSLIFLVVRRFKKARLLPWLLVGSACLFHLILWISQTPIASARAAGWLVSFPNTSSFFPHLWNPSTWKLLSPHAISHMSGLSATAAMTAVISILLNSSGIELSLNRDVDLNQELRAAGIANLLCGLAGGLMGFQSLNYSRIAHDLGSRSRLAGIVSASLCGLALIAGPSTLAFIPRFILGGILFNQGLGFLVEWLIEGRTKLTRSDYTVIVLIVGVMATFGYLEGVGIGLLAAVFLFIHNYSRVGVITHVLNGSEIHSNVERPQAYERLLKANGQGLHILKLQGFIFFGTANSLLHNLLNRAENKKLPPLKCVVLDFHRVSGLDSSAAISLAKSGRLAHRLGFRLAFSHVPKTIQHQIQRGMPSNQEASWLRYFPDLDHALEWWESHVLAENGIDQTSDTVRLGEQIWEEWPNPTTLTTFIARLERLNLGPSQHLIRQGDSAGCMFFIESGEVSTVLEGTPNSAPIRLRRHGPGTVLGELGMLLRAPRSASVITNNHVSYLCLTKESLNLLRLEHPNVAADFYEFLSRMLAERVINTNKSLKSLRD